jgi:hypothetical protein
MFKMTAPYILSDKKPLAKGGEKIVFQHPESDDLLIKVWQDRYLDDLRKRHSILSRHLRTPKYSALLNEVVEHVAVRELGEYSGYMQNLYGFVDTDMGLGIVVEAVRDKQGNLAKTLNEIVESGITEVHQRAFDDLMEWLYATHVVVRDYSLKNVVWDELNNQFVIIDGIGSRPVPSLRTFSKRYNRYSTKKKINKLRKRLENKIKKTASSVCDDDLSVVDQMSDDVK